MDFSGVINTIGSDISLFLQRCCIDERVLLCDSALADAVDASTWEQIDTIFTATVCGKSDFSYKEPWASAVLFAKMCIGSFETV